MSIDDQAYDLENKIRKLRSTQNDLLDINQLLFESLKRIATGKSKNPRTDAYNAICGALVIASEAISP